MSVLTLEAKLERTDSNTSWGFRMQGGKDFNSPLSIQNVNPGSLAAKCGLQVGDLILRIGNTDTENLRHKDAQAAILESGDHLSLLLQRIRDKRSQNGWGENVNSINRPQTDTSHTWKPAPQPYSPAGSVPNQSFNAAPRPFGSQTSPRSNYETGLSQKTSNLSLSSEPEETLGFQNAAERFSERNDAPDPAQHQSRSFKQLAHLMDEDREPAAAPKPYSGPSSPTVRPTPAPAISPIGPGSKPGTVKAIVSQRYNNPIGLYSKENVNTQLEGQSKFLVEGEDAAGKSNSPALPPTAKVSEYDEHGRKKYVPSETFHLVQKEMEQHQKEGDMAPVHSRLFKMPEQQLSSSGGPVPPPAPAYKTVPAPAFQSPKSPVATAVAAKPWAPSPAHASAPNVAPRPFGSGTAPIPTGVGATRGRKGDAAMNPAMLPAAGRIPVCSGCNMPIRGPFVTALGKCWCPDHFVCANPQCGTKLLDIGFVEEGGYLYCERDYAIHFAPHCDKCGQAVIGECVNALQKSFHPSCFLCAQCNKPISGSKFHVEEGKYYCEADWAAMFQTMCSGCNFPIEPGDRWVEALGKNFHSECFNCATCQVNLEGTQFCAKGGRAYCKKHAR